MNKFNQATVEKLKYYVYALTYLDDNNKEIVFYIGKGKANRIFSHFKEAQWALDQTKLLSDKEVSLTQKQKTF